MSGTADFVRAATSLALAGALCALPACGGGDGADAPSELQPLGEMQSALQGMRVSGRDEALQMVSRGVLAPLRVSELAHAVLVHAVEQRVVTRGTEPALSAEDRWTLALHAQPLGAGAMLEGPVAIEIETADHAEGMLLRGQAGVVRAVVRFEGVAVGPLAHIDGQIVLEVSRTAEAAGASRRSQADELSITTNGRTLRWSYLDVKLDAQQRVQTLGVVSDVPLDGGGSVWLDVTTTAPDSLDAGTAGAPLSSKRYLANGVIGFLQARLTLDSSTDGGWTIAVDNDKDDRTDFTVQASASELRALMPGL